MSIQDYSEDIILVDLPQESKLVEKLKRVMAKVRSRGGCHVILNFRKGYIYGGKGLQAMLELHNVLMIDYGRRLILCSVAAMKATFMIAGLDKVFEYADDKDAAIAKIQNAN